MRFRMSEDKYHRKICSVLPLSLRLSEEQEKQRREVEHLAREFVVRHRQAQAEGKRRAGQEAEILRILSGVIETRVAASFGVVTIRPGNEPREIEAVLETAIHPFSARELAHSGWTVRDWREGARLIVKVRDDAHLRAIAHSIRFASEAP